MLRYVDKLKSGMLIYTKFVSNNWIPNILIKATDKTLSIPISKNHIENHILEHDLITILYNTSNFDIKYFCVVEKILFKSNLSMELRILKEEFWKNLRKKNRIDVSFISHIVLDDSVINAYIIDISMSGCRITSTEQLEINQTYKIILFKDNIVNENVLVLYGIIKNKCAKESKLEYGIQFMNITSQESEVILHIIKNILDKRNKFIQILKNEYISE